MAGASVNRPATIVAITQVESESVLGGEADGSVETCSLCCSYHTQVNSESVMESKAGAEPRERQAQSKGEAGAQPRGKSSRKGKRKLIRGRSRE